MLVLVVVLVLVQRVAGRNPNHPTGHHFPLEPRLAPAAGAGGAGVVLELVWAL